MRVSYRIRAIELSRSHVYQHQRTSETRARPVLRSSQTRGVLAYSDTRKPSVRLWFRGANVGLQPYTRQMTDYPVEVSSVVTPERREQQVGLTA